MNVSTLYAVNMTLFISSLNKCETETFTPVTVSGHRVCSIGLNDDDDDDNELVYQAR